MAVLAAIGRFGHFWPLKNYQNEKEFTFKESCFYCGYSAYPRYIVTNCQEVDGKTKGETKQGRRAVCYCG